MSSLGTLALHVRPSLTPFTQPGICGLNLVCYVYNYDPSRGAVVASYRECHLHVSFRAIACVLHVLVRTALPLAPHRPPALLAGRGRRNESRIASVAGWPFAARRFKIGF